MIARRKRYLWVFLAFVTAILIAGITWLNYRYALTSPGGNDFLVHYEGTRAYIFEGISPYSDEVALRIQTAVYGRPAQAGEHELRVAYPLYSMVFFVPFAVINDFTLARAAWMTFLEAGLIALTILCIRLVRWKMPIWLFTLMMFFSLTWYHALRPLINGNAVILVAVLLVGGLLALRANEDELAGVLFAFSTIKPQVVVLILAFILVWGIYNRRGRMLTWFIVTMILMVGSTMLLIPDWLLQNLREVIRYPSYNPPGTPTAIFNTWWPGGLGTRIGTALSVFISLILVVEWWLARRSDFRKFLWTICLTMVLQQLIGIQTDAGNFIVLMPALILALGAWVERWPRGGTIFAVATLTVLLVGLWVLFISTIEKTYQPVQSPIMFFPMPLILLILLYWTRWWFMRSNLTSYNGYYFQGEE